MRPSEGGVLVGWEDVARRLLWLPEQASTIAVEIDRLHFFVIACTMLGALGCGSAALYFLVRYRRRHARQVTPRIVTGWVFETAIITLPLALFLLMWVLGFRQYIKLSVPPRDALDVYVQAKQWMWKFSYAGGPNAISTLHVPAGRPVRLLMTSRDVIHSFYVPDFRLKADVLPGRYTTMWFEAIRPGTHQILCAEMCGVGHSQMWGEVVVHDPAEFEQWLAEQRRGDATKQDGGASAATAPAADLVKQGERIAAEAGCLKCHSVDGSPHIGPTWRGLYYRRQAMQSGEVVTADEAYLTESMMDPLARIVAGYAPVMPTYQGRLGPPEIGALLEYIRSLRAPTVAIQAYPGGPVYEPAPAGR